jgi:hypothetical protein
MPSPIAAHKEQGGWHGQPRAYTPDASSWVEPTHPVEPSGLWTGLGRPGLAWPIDLAWLWLADVEPSFLLPVFPPRLKHRPASSCHFPSSTTCDKLLSIHQLLLFASCSGWFRVVRLIWYRDAPFFPSLLFVSLNRLASSSLKCSFPNQTGLVSIPCYLLYPGRIFDEAIRNPRTIDTVH